MSMFWRTSAMTFALSGVLMIGCEKSGSSGGAPNKGGEETYSKKLVGAWETTEDFDGKKETATMEFKGDGTLGMVMGPFEMEGTWKTIKEDGKTLQVETTMTLKGFPDAKAKEKPDTKSFSIVFDDADTISMSKLEGKPEAKTFKRKK